MTGHQDFQGHVDKTVRMDVPEKEGIRGPEVTIKMRPQVREGFPDCQVLEGQQDLWDLQDWDFQAHQEREANQEIRDVQA